MIFFLAVLVIPVLIGLAFYLMGGKGFTTKELLVHIGIQLVIAGVCTGITYFRNTVDTETWNGAITSKQSVRVSCSHDYCCSTCYREVCSGSGEDRSCHTESYCCRTCYEHSYDVDWRVQTNIGEQFEISRVDRQGVREPPRWTQIYTGEPYSSWHYYKNYIKAAPDTLFRREGAYEKFAGSLPAYPGTIYDYYRINRVVPVGVRIPDAPRWNQRLSEINAVLGPKKQANVILVVVANQPPEYFSALEQKWLGGKKNDVVTVASVDPTTLEYQWVKVMAWTYDEMVKVKIRDDLMDSKTLQLEPVIQSLQANVDRYFQRKHMKDFQYLAATIAPTPLAWAISLCVSVIVGIVSALVFLFADPFGDE